jgi:hypothetical protein
VEQLYDHSIESHSWTRFPCIQFFFFFSWSPKEINHTDYCLSTGDDQTCPQSQCPGKQWVLGLKGGTAVAVRKDIPHNHVDLPSLVFIEVTGICIPVGNSEVLLAAVYKPPGQAWSSADIIDLLSLMTKSLLPGDLNAKKILFWNSQVLNPSGEKLLNLFDNSDLYFKASVSHSLYTTGK